MGKFTFDNNAMLKVLTIENIKTIHKNALHILEHTGVHFWSSSVLDILEETGLTVDRTTNIVRFKPEVVIKAIESAPECFTLYNRFLEPWVNVGGDEVSFDVGSATIRMLESDGCTLRPTTSEDLQKIAQVTEFLDNIRLVSTALTPHDIPEFLGDSYRVYSLLKNSTKPFIAGAFSTKGVNLIHEYLSIAAGSSENAKKYPRILLDVCPTSPLRWCEIGCANLLDATRLDIPIQTISVPMIGASAPATLAGCVLLHTVETLSGIALVQTIKPGHPMVYGSAPMYFDMKNMTTSLNSVETSLIGTAVAQMGKYYGMPTHTYAALSDAKLVDTQAGLESAISGLISQLAGINIISGPGLLEFGNIFSLEKLVIDNEICGMANRYARGIEVNEETLAADLIDKIGHEGDYLGTRHTVKWIKKEPYIPSKLIDRRVLGSWQADGSKDTFALAQEIVSDILKNKPVPKLDPNCEAALDKAYETALKQV